MARSITPNEIKWHFDPVTRWWLSMKSVEVLRRCPVDVFFVACTAKGLLGSTLKSLALKGFLNMEVSKDGLTIEYYVNSNGHRVMAEAAKTAKAKSTD